LRGARRSRFAAGIALAMLAVNLVGFGPTLYFRPFFDVPPMPAYLYAHGIAGTAWFGLLVVQTLLIARRRVSVHRQLGWVGAAVAVAVLLLGIYTSTNMVPRNVAAGLTSEADIALYSVVTAADNAAFIVFPTLVLLGVLFRRRADVHQRFMLLASFSIIGPAAARIASWYGPIPNIVGAACIFSFLLAIVVHDIWSRRRPHWATIVGGALFIVMNAGMRLSGIGPALVEQRMEQMQSAEPDRP
jgi:uncharacterized membrane protein YozB (DUF420 family)